MTRSRGRRSRSAQLEKRSKSTDGHFCRCDDPFCTHKPMTLTEYRENFMALKHDYEVCYAKMIEQGEQKAVVDNVVNFYSRLFNNIEMKFHGVPFSGRFY